MPKNRVLVDFACTFQPRRNVSAADEKMLGRTGGRTGEGSIFATAMVRRRPSFGFSPPAPQWRSGCPQQDLAEDTFIGLLLNDPAGRDFLPLDLLQHLLESPPFSQVEALRAAIEKLPDPCPCSQSSRIVLPLRSRRECATPARVRVVLVNVLLQMPHTATFRAA